MFQAEDGIRCLVRSRGLGDVYKRQGVSIVQFDAVEPGFPRAVRRVGEHPRQHLRQVQDCLLYTSDAADERSSVDLGGRRIIKKKIAVIEQKTRQDHNHTNRWTR